MRYAIGIDLGGTNIAVGLVNEKYELMRKASQPTGADRPWQEIVADMAALALRLMTDSGLDAADCAGIGVGSPGTCNAATGEVVYSNNIRWAHVPLGSEITRLTGRPCRVSNDANCAAMGETVAGAAKGCRNVVLMTLGTGVGGGLIVNGELVEGMDSAGAELGHTTLIADGEPCTCGRRGCVESYASATALIRQARAAAKAHPESLLNRVEIDAKAVYDGMDQGDAVAAEVVRQYEAWLSEAITNMVNLLRPEMLLLGGGVSGQGERLTAPLNNYVREHCFGGDLSYVTKIATASLGNLAGIIGAAALCLREQKRTPLLLSPAYKDYLWGGEKLKGAYGKQTAMTPLAESWEVSCHPDGPSVVMNGPWAGRTLADYLAAHPADQGERALAYGEFPLLIKFIDAAKPLSVQVHPGDDYARQYENAQGKTEMWYVAEAEEGAGIYYGFKEAITLQQMKEAIAASTLTEALNWAPAKKGDVFFIPAGTVHAIGAGLLIAEVQQSSNLTYRVYDYGRLGADGKPRALHIDKALAVSKREYPHADSGAEDPVAIPGGESQVLVRCERFTVSRLRVKGAMAGMCGRESFRALLCLAGEGAVLWDGQAVALRQGQSVFLPAGLGAYSLAGEMELLTAEV